MVSALCIGLGALHDRIPEQPAQVVRGAQIHPAPAHEAGQLGFHAGWGEEWLYVYLLLEFQSRTNPFMAVRILSYVGLLYQELVRGRQLAAGGKLPPVLPLVLYNGAPRWRAATEVADLVATVPGGLERYRPRMCYLLLDRGRVGR